MTQEQAYRINEWLTYTASRSVTADEFEKGLALLGEVMPNTFYLGNIRRKGPVSGASILKYELQKRSSECLKFGVSKVEVKAEDRRQKAEWSSECLKFGVPKVEKSYELFSTQTSDQSSNNTETQKTERETRNTIILRKEFPFLAANDCPEEFKILVNDMINSHERYVKGHRNLFAVANKGNEACFEAGKLVVENYLNNRKCWDELEYYKKTGQILGEHELFAKRKRENELKDMLVTDLMALYRNLPRNIRYYGKLIEDDKDNEMTADRLKKKEWFEWELKIVKRLMDIKEQRARSKAERDKKKASPQPSAKEKEKRQKAEGKKD